MKRCCVDPDTVPLFGLRHYPTSWKVAGSIPDEVIIFFKLPNLPTLTMALGST
jgi:hypothetical protein